MLSTLPPSLSLPAPLNDYLLHRRFWAGAADFDFWYALNADDWFWLHLRRNGETTLALSLFSPHDGPTELELFDLSRAPVHGLRATIVNTPLMTLHRYEPPLPIVALRLRNGTSQCFTLPRAPQTVADQWLADAMRRLHDSLAPRWRMVHALWDADFDTLRALWPDWAGPRP